MGGASRGRRPLGAGTALRLSRSLPPARRRSGAALPASPSQFESWRLALRHRAPSTEPPLIPQPRDRGTLRRQPRGGGRGRGAPSPRPPDGDQAGTAAAPVSLRLPPRRAWRRDCSPRGPGGSRRLSGSVCRIVLELPARGLRQRNSVLSFSGTPGSRASRWGQLASAERREPASGLPVGGGGDRCHPPVSS